MEEFNLLGDCFLNQPTVGVFQNHLGGFYGKIIGDEVEILSGLDAKEPYIISAKGKLYNGAKVSVK